MKNGSSRLLRRVALVRTDVSEEPGASFIRVTKIGELGTTQHNRRHVPPKRRFLQEPHGVTTQKTPFLTVHQFVKWRFPSMTYRVSVQAAYS
jgi:hypothetical protein